MKIYTIWALLFANLISSQTISLLKDINTGAAASSPNYFTEYKGKLYFSAATAEYGTELWSTDGTETGTTMLVDKIPGSSSFLPSNIKLFNNKLYISNLIGNTSNPIGIYSFDGSTLKLVTSVIKGPGMLCPGDDDLYIGYESKLYKMGYDEVFTNITGEISISNNMEPVNGKLVIAGKPNSSTLNNYQLYKYENGVLGLLKTINPTATANPQSFFYSSSIGKILFCAGSAESSFELWVTDGTEQGTYMLKDINTTTVTSSSFPSNFTQIGNRIFFTANNDVNGNELWVTDGTAEGTKMVKDIYPGSNESAPSNLTELNGKLYFFAKDGSNEAKLWESDGTENGTNVILELRPGYTSFTIGKMAAYNGALYVSAKLYVNLGQELYKITLPVLSTDNIEERDRITIYPNPTEGKVYFNNLETGTYQLFDMNGRLVQSDKINKNSPAYLKARSGIYQMHFTNSSGKTGSSKIIIK